MGAKGVAAYADHAAVLGYEKDEIFDFLMEALASTTKDLEVDEMIGLVLKAGEVAVTTMATLDEANTTAYGNPEITEVNIGVGSKPGILISGHDLKDMEELLEQTKDSGVDVYTHGEMLPANYYPAFKKYEHFVKVKEIYLFFQAKMANLLDQKGKRREVHDDHSIIRKGKL